MAVAGVDVGSANTKAVILNDDNGKIESYAIVPTAFNFAGAASKAMEAALQKISLSMEQVKYIVLTGYGRRAVSFGNKAVTEIRCHAIGAHLLLRRVRTIIDIGGQDSKVIGLDEEGNVTRFAMNDKCAAGTGRFLEVIAKALSLDINKIGPIALTSKNPCQISSVCTVFAESETITLAAEGRSVEDVLAGLHKAVALRVAALGASVGYKKEVVLTGGVAKNLAVRKFLEDEIGMEIIVPEDPQIVGALGAAVLAKRQSAVKN